MSELDVLKGRFDVKLHKATFIRYLDVVVMPDGTIVYATPSHLDVLEKVARYMGFDISLDAYRRSGARLTFGEWLMSLTGCVCVWTTGYTGHPNDVQRRTIDMLVDEGLMDPEEDA